MALVAQVELALPRGRATGEVWMWDPRVPSCPSWKERAACEGQRSDA